MTAKYGDKLSKKMLLDLFETKTALRRSDVIKYRKYFNDMLNEGTITEIRVRGNVNTAQYKFHDLFHDVKPGNYYFLQKNKNDIITWLSRRIYKTGNIYKKVALRRALNGSGLSSDDIETIIKNIYRPTSSREEKYRSGYKSPKYAG